MTEPTAQDKAFVAYLYNTGQLKIENKNNVGVVNSADRDEVIKSFEQIASTTSGRQFINDILASDNQMVVIFDTTSKDIGHSNGDDGMGNIVVNPTKFVNGKADSYYIGSDFEAHQVSLTHVIVHEFMHDKENLSHPKPLGFNFDDVMIETDIIIQEIGEAGRLTYSTFPSAEILKMESTPFFTWENYLAEKNGGQYLPSVPFDTGTTNFSQELVLVLQETLEQFATQSGIDFAELLGISGNEYLEARKFIADGVEYILTTADDILHLPEISAIFGINPLLRGAVSLFDQAMNFILIRSDPILLDMDSDGLELTSVVGSNVRFDINNNGIPVTTGWVSPDDAMLAMDDNGNGTIDNLNELFGNNSIAGFAELATLDSNLDGKISNLDTQFNNIKVWQDLNSNGVSEAGELKTLSQHGIESISLNSTPTNFGNNGNFVAAISSFTRTDGTSSNVSEVLFATDNFNSTFNNNNNGTNTVELETLFMPQSRGYGLLAPWHVAMSNWNSLLTSEACNDNEQVQFKMAA